MGIESVSLGLKEVAHIVARGCRGSPVWVLSCPKAGKDVSIYGPWVAKLEAGTKMRSQIFSRITILIISILSSCSTLRAFARGSFYLTAVFLAHF